MNLEKEGRRKRVTIGLHSRKVGHMNVRLKRKKRERIICMNRCNIHVNTTLRHLSGYLVMSRPLINRFKRNNAHLCHPIFFVTLDDSYVYNYHPILP